MSDQAIENPIKKKPLYTRPKFIMGAIASIIFLILIFQNWDAVDIRIFFWKQEGIPAAIPYFLFSLLGFGAGWLVRRSKSASSNDKKPSK